MRTRLARSVGPALVTLALLAVVEAGLRLAGYRAPVRAFGDPFLNLTPFFARTTRADGVAVMRRRDGEVEFLADKPPNGFRVFVLGESSAHGFPYGPGYSFAGFLQARLSAALPGFVVEVVNCGVDGIASWHLRRIVREVVGYRPDVVLVYAGHNEYLTPEVGDAGRIVPVLARLRFYQLAVEAGTAWRRWRHGPIDERSLASPDQPYGAARLRALGLATLSAGERAQIVERFEENLAGVVDDVQSAGALPVLTSIAQDLRDSAPGAWRHAPELSQASAARWLRYAEDGDARRRAGDCPAALAAFHAAMRIDRRPAALHYARARCLEALGRFRTARREYQRASDLDEAPLGAPSVVNRCSRRLAARAGVPFIDVERAVERASAHGLVGRRWFVDAIHPSLAGHQLIAATIAAAFRRRGLPVPGDDWSPGGYCEPDPAAILREHPRLARKEYESRILLQMMLGRTDRALREVRDGEERFPELRAAAQQIATFVRTDTGEPRIKSAWR